VRLARENADLAKQKNAEVRRALPVDPSELINPLLPAINQLINNTQK
jgi:hypothetical protein